MIDRTAFPIRRRKSDRPRELLVAALDMFIEKGFAAARAEEIAARAGVSKGTLYLYFDSKEELLHGLIAQRFFCEFPFERDGCAEAAAASGEVVEAVNFNDPKQTVIAGTRAGVDKGCEVLKAKGAKRALLLSVSAPFHCSLMKPAAERLREQLAAVPISPPRIAVVNNVDVAVVHDPAGIRDALYRQAFGAVRWVETVQALRARGLVQLIECGPGKALSGMVKRIDPQALTMTILDPGTLAEAKALLA